MPISISSRDRHTAITRRLILVVEDMPDTMTTVTSMLGDLGYDCVTAVDGPSALRVLSESGVIDGMLTDIGLPGEWSGLDLAELAVQTLPGLKIATMSGYKEEQMIGGAKKSRQWPHLLKPFLRQDLAKTMAVLFPPDGAMA